MAWWFRIVLGDFPASFMAPYRSSRCLAVELVERHLAEPGPDGLLDLRPVGPDAWSGERSSRSHSSSHWSRSWPKVAPTPSAPAGALLVDEVPEGIVCGTCACRGTSSRLALYLPVTGSFPRETRSSQTPCLISRFDPRTRASVSLRPVFGIGFGISVGQQKGRSLRDRP